jgi:PAS domain-containing protein
MLRRLDRDIPFILLTDNYDAASTTAVLKAGGQGAVPYTERALLMLVVDRELTDLDERRRRLLEAHLCKAEQRCQRLLESSKDAIAYVIEGMHVYVNAAEHPILNDKKTINHVHRALDDDRFRLIFQPVINLCGENKEHYEVYVRMLNDKSKEVSPYDFLPPPGLTDTAVRVDRWIFLQAIKNWLRTA